MERKLWMVSMASLAVGARFGRWGTGRSLVLYVARSVQVRVFLVGRWAKSIDQEGVGQSLREGRLVCGWERGGAVRWQVGHARMSEVMMLVMEAQVKWAYRKWRVAEWWWL
jgi:hypothetical protein